MLSVHDRACREGGSPGIVHERLRITSSDPSPRPRALDAQALAVAASRAAGHALYLGRGRDGPAFAPPEHCVLVVGPPRSGKTTGVVVPNVLAASGSVLVASTKPDILLATVAARERLGPCLLFDPSGKITAPPGVEVVGWSPLTSSLEWDAAVLTAEAMVGAARPASDLGDAAHWTERAGALLACVLHAAALDGASIDAVVSAVNRHEADRYLTVLARNGADLALDLLSGIMATDGREQSGIWSTASGVLAGYRTAASLASARARPLDPAELVGTRATLYLAASSEHQRHVAPLVAGLVRDVRSAAYTHAAARGTGGRAPQPLNRGTVPAVDGRDAPLLLILDELAGIAPLHDLPTLVAEGASQGLLTLACLQDLSQARARWGTAADGFLTLFGTKIVLPGIGDIKTLEALSLLAGEHEVPRVSTTRSSGLLRRGPGSRTLSTTRMRRLPPELIANAPSGTAIVFVGTKPGRIAFTPAHSRTATLSPRARSLGRGGRPGLGREL
ncbi:MAG: hypothetical protein JWO62_866 [Acidimicrobiaceae bacterium]|nr:hypothetical protein [Acidimicrobiaceae bacterium]